MSVKRVPLLLPQMPVRAGFHFPGSIIACASMVVLPKLGASWALLLIVLGQLLIGLLADHFGWLGLVQVPINKERILGTILVLVGCWLFNRSN